MPLLEELKGFRDAVRSRDWPTARHHASNIMRIVADLTDIARTGMAPTEEERAECKKVCREIGDAVMPRGTEARNDPTKLTDAVLSCCEFLGLSE
jgi:hypothetical protein